MTKTHTPDIILPLLAVMIIKVVGIALGLVRLYIKKIDARVINQLP